MKLGLIGLGKMGYNLALNLLNHKHELVVSDINPQVGEQLAGYGAAPAASLEELVAMLAPPRVIWVMVPAGEVVEGVITTLAGLLEPGDILIDGGNSHYRESAARAELLLQRGIYFFDSGTSGGTEGAAHGACFMVGGDAAVFRTIEPLFRDLAVDQGYLYAGESGSGHFLKMIHNGIEYGMMQSIAEGFELLERSSFSFNYEDVARLWSSGSVIRGWLMELAQQAFAKDPKLSGIRGVMQSSGEGKWTVQTALELEASTPVIALSLLMRYRSLQEDTFHGKVVAALRNEFGGHAVLPGNGAFSCC
ncbi:phosphogluconate dehydrogenase (NAD(+)-dependent, decarboxylating) [Paenibacillus sp. MMS20-IR301]|uniref:phosphogluconate dehydrogenase (NAD(+)-dependent, decarboxylating) n=1 Tax=Paenibacillus sp. MMS20-IR301 TaxID=2895946 RepID=UPI0028F0C7B2|nr:decarboxylating 6-phosphogluconate dehydrogenase [Paenibacillus sp. MMS20-IR301]WNS42108.1 decarboxylating 6-phosphogluconate dehydrogenase [Paenibacillus sp. MMS20-IR301]